MYFLGIITKTRLDIEPDNKTIYKKYLNEYKKRAIWEY